MCDSALLLTPIFMLLSVLKSFLLVVQQHVKNEYSTHNWNSELASHWEDIHTEAKHLLDSQHQI